MKDIQQGFCRWHYAYHRYVRTAISVAVFFFVCCACLTLFNCLRLWAAPAASERAQIRHCYIEGRQVFIHATLDMNIVSDPAGQTGQDPNLYLLELQPYEDSVEGKHMLAAMPKAASMSFELPLYGEAEGERLYNKFVLAVWDGERYQRVSEPVYITNPEAVAANNLPYRRPASKKGLLLDTRQAATALRLGASHILLNIACTNIFGSGIRYEHDGEVYEFNEAVLAGYDRMVKTFSSHNMQVTAVILNRYNPATPQLFFPWVNGQEPVYYYQFNTSTAEGYRAVRAIASFLAERYSGLHSEYGKISNWIIGNEINNQQWNFLGARDIAPYLYEFERSFRVFYTAIRSQNGSDKVFISLDNQWLNGADHSMRYNAKDALDVWNGLVRLHGNINWNLAFHPYPYPLTEPEFWDDSLQGMVQQSELTPVITPLNIQVLTDYLSRPEFKDRQGYHRRVILSEQGFSSLSQSRGEVEALQAAAYAYAYYLFDANPYIDAFILSRQVDAPSELAQGLALGMYHVIGNNDLDYSIGEPKKIVSVYKEIDMPSRTLAVTEFARQILGIARWSQLIPNFRWKNLE